MSVQQQIKSVLAQLPPVYAAMLLMKKHDGKSTEEIAQEFGYSAHTVKKYLFRAVTKCRTQMKCSHD